MQLHDLEHPILIVDDEDHFLKSISFFLQTKGLTGTVTCNDSRKVLSLLAGQSFSIIFLDLVMPYLSGIELLTEINTLYPDLSIIIITAESQLEKIIKCIKLGAYDYIVKPIDTNRILTTIKNITELHELRNVNNRIKHRLITNNLTNPDHFEDIITTDKTMSGIFNYIEAIAPTILPVLITGDTGTGKELIARAVHRASNRSGNFVACNIGGMDSAFISDSLFGHLSGSYTGAKDKRKGLIETAANGTLFLDEIGDLDNAMQIKLLRLLQEKKYYPIGSDTEKRSDVRFIFATNKSIDKSVTEGTFRKDLYYRLQSHHIQLPALHQRKDDIQLLINYFLEQASQILKKNKPTVPRELYTLLKNYSFPGNIRELEGMIFDAVSRHVKGILSLDSFYNKVGKKTISQLQDVEESQTLTSIFKSFGQLPTLSQIEDTIITEALHRSEGNQSMAAKMLGLSRKSLHYRLVKQKKDHTK